MTVSASLAESSVTVEPGGEARVAVQVLNSGDTVEEVRFEVAGACAAWAAVEPAGLSLYPGRSGTAVLALRPPRGPEVPAGTTPFGVRVVPTSEASETVVPEGSVTVTPFGEVAAELVPRSSLGALRGRHRVAVDNTGNVPVTVALAGQQGTQRARLAFEPAELEIPPGQAKFGRLTVRPAARMWRGSPTTHPFQAVVTPRAAEGEAAPAPVVVDGVYEQQPLLPRWLPRALLAAVVVAALLVGLWYSVLRPTVESAAREAITPEAIEEAQENAGGAGGESAGGGGSGGADAGASAGGGAPADGQETSGAGGGDGGAEGAGGGPEGETDGAGGAGTSSVPTSDRLEIQDGVGGGTTQGTVYEVPEDSVLELTDIVVQNPQGDAGSLVISSQGEPLLSLALENFRDSDYHFVSPIAVPAGGEIDVSLACREVGTPVAAPSPGECSEAVFISGMLRAA